MSKYLLFFSFLLSTSIFAQSPTAFRSLDLTGDKGYGSPVEYNVWAGSTLSYPLVGKNFDLSFGVSGKVVIDFTKFDLGRTWYLLTYGDLGLPNYNRVSAFSNVVSTQEGLGVGLQGYTIFGNLKSTALTTIINIGAKLNSFGSTEIYSYRFGLGWEASLRDSGLPIILNISPAYILLSEKSEFVKVQAETSDTGIWITDAFVIIPVGDKLGLLSQINFTKKTKPEVRLGIIMSAGL